MDDSTDKNTQIDKDTRLDRDTQTNKITDKKLFLALALSFGGCFISGCYTNLGVREETRENSKYTSSYVYNTPRPAKSTVIQTNRAQPSIESIIQSDLRKSLNDEQCSFLVYDLNNDKTVVSLNSTHSLQSASLIKPYIALAYFHSGKKIDNELMSKMIKDSDNDATNKIMKILGGPKIIDATLKKYYPKIFRNTNIVEYIPEGGKTYKNTSCANDYSMFLIELYHDRLPKSFELRKVMENCADERIKTGNMIRVCGKTGTTSYLCGAIGIVETAKLDYVFVGVIQKSRKATSLSEWRNYAGNIILNISAITNNYLKDNGLLVSNR